MDYLTEGIALGVDLVIFAACVKQYYKNKNAMAMIQVQITSYVDDLTWKKFAGCPVPRDKQRFERNC
jgi:hypothetical protein